MSSTGAIRVTAKTADELSSFGKCYAACGDLSTPEGAQAVIDYVDALGELNIFVGNMGTYKGYSPFAQISDEEWDWMMNTNLYSQIRMCRHFLPKMLARNSGRMVLVASECGIKPLTDMVHYSVSKTAVIGLARALAELTKGTKVAVNSLLPGLTGRKTLLLIKPTAPIVQARIWIRRSRNTLSLTSRPSSSSGLPRSTKWPLQSFITVLKFPLLQTEQLSAQRAASSEVFKLRLAILDTIHAM